MSATSATCAQRTGASSPAVPATTCGRPWRSTGSASTSATVGYMAPRGVKIGRDRLYGREPADPYTLPMALAWRPTGDSQETSPERRSARRDRPHQPLDRRQAVHRHRRALGRGVRPRDRAGRGRTSTSPATPRSKPPSPRPRRRCRAGAGRRWPAGRGCCSPSASCCRPRKHELAKIVTSEHGKVESDAAGEVARAIENVEYACGAAQLLKGGFSENASTGVDVYSIAQPLGVVGVISPFNFPAMVPLWFVPERAGLRQHRRAQAE